MELGVTDSVRALVAPGCSEPVAPELSTQLQHGFWGSSPAGEKEVGGLKGLAVATAGGRHLHDQAGDDPGLKDVLQRLFGPQVPGDVATVADLVVCCHERNPAFSQELAMDLAAQRLQVGLDRQKEDGAPLLELPKNGLCVWARRLGSELRRNPARRAAAAAPPAHGYRQWNSRPGRLRPPRQLSRELPGK